MAYKINFDEKRKARFTWSDNEKQSVLFKKGAERDEIVIKAQGRNIHSKHRNWNVIYFLYDYSMKKDDRKRIEISIACKDSGEITGIIVKPTSKYLYNSTRPVTELMDAILVVDTHYSIPGYGVTWRFPLHQNPQFTEDLKVQLTKLLS